MLLLQILSLLGGGRKLDRGFLLNQSLLEFKTTWSKADWMVPSALKKCNIKMGSRPEQNAKRRGLYITESPIHLAAIR